MPVKLLPIITIFMLGGFNCFAQKSEYTMGAPEPATPYKPYFDGKLFMDTGSVAYYSMRRVANDSVHSANKTPALERVLGKKPVIIRYSLDSSVANGLSHALYDENEPHLPLAGNHFIIRFLWLRSLTGDVIIKLIERENKLIIQFRWSKSLRTDTKELPAAKLKEFEAILNQNDFWTTKPAKAQVMTTDGSGWLIEAQDGSKYHFVCRRNPYEDCPQLYRIGQWLIENSYCKSNIGDIY